MTKKLVAGDGVHICYHCLNSCSDSITAGKKEVKQKYEESTTEPEHPGDCVHEKPTPLENQWFELYSSVTNEKELLRQGKAWLKKNKDDKAAGLALSRLIEINPSSALLSIASAWLKKFPRDQQAPALVANLMTNAPSRQITKLASMWLESPSELWQIEDIIRATIDSTKYSSLFKSVEDLLERHPDSKVWNWALRATSSERNKRSDKLLARWLQLNVQNAELPVYLNIVLAKSPVILEAGFDWMRSGGKATRDTALCLPHLLRASARYHKPLLPRMIRFARAWLKTNPDDEEAGRIHGALLSVTRSKKDIDNAKDWYRHHETNKRAWFILSDLLSCAYYNALKPDRFAVEQAKLLLRDEQFRHENPRFVGALLGAWVDEESVGWAKETFERLGLVWILARLLMRAPDSESIRNAERVCDNWKNSEVEPEILLGILRAEPGNAFALRHAKSWLKRNRKHAFFKSIKSIVENGKPRRCSRY